MSHIHILATAQLQWCRYNTYHVTMLVKMLLLRQLANMKGLGVDFEYTTPGMPQKMAMLSANLLPFKTRYLPCSMVVSSMLIFGMVVQTLICFSKLISELWIEPSAHVNDFFRREKASCFWWRTLMKCVLPPTEITITKLS